MNADFRKGKLSQEYTIVLSSSVIRNLQHISNTYFIIARLKEPPVKAN